MQLSTRFYKFRGAEKKQQINGFVIGNSEINDRFGELWVVHGENMDERE